MSLEKTYKDEKDKIANEEYLKLHGEPKEEKEVLTTQEILADRDMSDLFGKMMEQTGDHADAELATRIAAKTLEQADFIELEKFRVAFEQKMNMVESVGEELTPEMISELGEQSPDFKILLNSLSPEATSSMVHDRLAELSVTDPTRFEKISDKVEKLQEYRKGDYKIVEDSVKKIAEENKIDIDTFIKTLAIDDAKTREKTLQKLVQANWNGKWYGSVGASIGKIIDITGILTGKDVKQLDLKKAEVDAVLVELSLRKGDIGKILSCTITENEQMRDAFAKAIHGESTRIERIGMKETTSSLPKEKEIDTDWIPFKEAINVGGKKWDVLTSAEKDIQRVNFSENMKKKAKMKQGNKKGFWASLFDSIFGSFIDEKVKKLN